MWYINNLLFQEKNTTQFEIPCEFNEADLLSHTDDVYVFQLGNCETPGTNR